MRRIHRSATVPYTPAQMYDLVNDIEDYPKFLPWCAEARVIQRDDQQIRAAIRLARSGIDAWFTTRNLLHPPQETEMQLVEGPFKHLHGRWQFEPLSDEGCRVSLDMAFELSSRWLSMTVGPVFNRIANSLVDAFVERAHEVYGDG